MSISLEAALARQFAILRVQAECAEARGFAVLVNGLNEAGDFPDYLYPAFSGAFTRLMQTRQHTTGRRFVVIHVYPADKPQAIITGQVLDHGLTFSMELPRAVRYRPICAAIELMASHWDNKKRRYVGAGMFEHKECSDRHEYVGRSKDALETMVGILSIPEHRRILTRA